MLAAVVRYSTVFTGLLVLIGAVGTWFALRTLRTIERQTAALIESQRPRIAAEACGDPTQTLQDMKAPRIQMAPVNKGPTAARDLTHETWTELLPLPFKDFTSSADYFQSTHPTVLYPNHSPLVINIPVRQGITQQQIADLKALRLYMCFRIRTTYSDAFSPARSVSFGFVVYREGSGYLPKYNEDS